MKIIDVMDFWKTDAPVGGEKKKGRDNGKVLLLFHLSLETKETFCFIFESKIFSDSCLV